MTTTSSTASNPTAQSKANQAARQSAVEAATTRLSQRSPIKLFANLLGLIGASDGDQLKPATAPSGKPASAEGAEPEDPDTILPNDPSLVSLSTNPLADLIGWPGAAAAAAAAEAGDGLAKGQPGGATDTAGLPLQGMAVLAQPTAADPSLVSDLKNPATAAHAAPASPLPSNAQPAANAAANPAADPDAVSVRYGETSETQTQAEGAKPARANTYMAALPANWRSTTALATSAQASNLPTSAPTQTSALQETQNAAAQRNPLMAASLPGQRNTVALSDRLSDSAASAADASANALSALGAPGQASQGQAGSSGQGREGPLLAGISASTGPADADAPEEAFSLDAALATEEELEGAEFISPQQIRHASMRVGEGTDEALDIRLSMKGDAVSVDFRTDNAEVRAGLQSNAEASLSDLLQRGGVQLGGLSVGGQSLQQRGQSGGAEAGPNGTVRSPSGRNSANQGLADLQPRAPIARRSDGGPALDVFA